MKKRSTRGLSGDTPHPGLGLAPLASLLKEVIAKNLLLRGHGRFNHLAIVLAATTSGGATIAPDTNAAAQDI